MYEAFVVDQTTKVIIT